MQDHSVDDSKILMIQSKEIITPLQKNFEKSCQHTNQNSELCRYLPILKINIEYLKDLIPADRSGNWHTHLQSVQKLLLFFAEH